MNKLPKFLQSAIAEADKMSVKMPYERGNRPPLWLRKDEADPEEPMLRSA